MDAFTLPFFTAREVIETSPPGWALIDIRKRPAAQASGQTLVSAQYVDPLTLSLDHPILARLAHGRPKSATRS